MAFPLVQSKKRVGGGDPEVEPFDDLTTITLDANVTVGNLLAVWHFYGGTVANFVSISDNLGNAYSTVLLDEPPGGGTDTHCLFIAPVTVGGACTISIVLNALVGYRSIIVHEVAGRALSRPVNVVRANFQASPGTGANAITAGEDSTSMPGCYIFGVTAFEETGARALTPGTGFTAVETSPGTGTPPGNGSGAFASEELLQAAAGSVTVAFTTATNGPCNTVMMALEPAPANLMGQACL